uniref:DDHD domain-containing protein n=2 Tax=Leptocylindrus danicus TaxID=163516 RepID=A0A7S2L9M1_9STRA|mmetsp:Transcript_33779/g.48912  ORF Transcript_33779/g.48912 Transcript_33779/m.48912 type:complete len:647 (+) Transcript_33779:100-2040(+)
MSAWTGIEDGQPIPTKVWLSRSKAVAGNGSKSKQTNSIWMPLRKCDCISLNEAPDAGKVHVEGGRATADKEAMALRYNFYNSPTREMCYATWFLLDEKMKDTSRSSDGKQKILPQPLSPDDCEIVEALYQKIAKLRAKSTPITDQIMNETQSLLKSDSKYKVALTRRGDSFRIVKRPASSFSIFSGDVCLQRGYGPYTVEGEEEELSLGPVGHLIFVVHGIGEAMWSRPDVPVPSMIEEMDKARFEIHKLQVREWKEACKATEDQKKVPLPPPPHRIELLPIQWYDRIHSSSTSLMKSLGAVTITSIPALRAIANDVVFDVLMYQTPSFCKEVLNCVTTQINDLFVGFQTVHKNFTKEGGRCSIIGHSLGSIIVWDLLSVLKMKQMKGSKADNNGRSLGTPISIDTLCGNAAVATDESPEEYSWGPILQSPMEETISFQPEFTMFLGSPIGIFLTLRGAHASFDALRGEKPGEISSPFTLPTKNVYNIFHPSDPVAYRIEPLLLPEEFGNAVPAAAILDSSGLRFHVKAKQMQENVINQIKVGTKTFGNIFSKVSDVVSTGNLKDLESVVPQKKEVNCPDSLSFALGGASNPRVDYCLQLGLVDNEYLSALTAHTSYFTNGDILQFIVNKSMANREWKDVDLQDLT